MKSTVTHSYHSYLSHPALPLDCVGNSGGEKVTPTQEGKKIPRKLAGLKFELSGRFAIEVCWLET